VLLYRQTSANRQLLDVVGVLFSRALKARYRGSTLGVLWSAVSPLGMAAVYVAIFGRTFAPYYGSLAAYAASVYIGLTLVGFYVGGTTQAVSSIVQNAGLLKKIRIPFEAFPLATIAAFGFQQVVVTIPLLVVVSVVLNHDPLHLVLLLVPLGALALLAVGVSLFVSAACVYFRDVSYLYELSTFLFWVTSPVFYPAQIVHPAVVQILRWNPLFEILESSRTLILTSGLPDFRLLGASVLECAIAFGLGAAAFRAMRPQFMDRV
jgi:lipopolysaccharide transport system permease protein